MKLADFDYQLPKDLIAQYPAKPRENSRLLILDRRHKNIRHLRFSNVASFLNPGDCLVLNNTKVLSSRLIGRRENDNLKVDFLLLNRIDKFTFRVLVKPYKKLNQHDCFIFNGGKTRCQITDIKNKFIRFESGDILERLDQIGSMPLPPYIKRLSSDSDRYDYQTVFADIPGAVASPTAGLHFSEKLLEEIKAKGVNIAYITLHVGYGTFRPVRADNVTEHRMEKEQYFIPEQTLKILKETKKKNKRIFCAGTTTCRSLETIGEKIFHSTRKIDGWTDLFIYPGYKFRVTNSLITNFHLPRTTLLMLVSAFAGRDLILQAYHEAIKEDYRFYSYGDAMLIL